MSSIRLLVVEDTSKHMDDARRYAQQLVGVTVDFASTLAEAMELLQKNAYDGVICDVFFPAAAGASTETFENAITLSTKLVEMGVQHVFNTAGNHHGRKYEGFIWKTPRVIHTENPDDCYDFRTTGMIIESYESDADTDSKQWEAAFRYILLVKELLQLPDKGTQIINKECGDAFCGFPYGDYGELTERLRNCSHSFVVEVFKKYNA